MGQRHQIYIIARPPLKAREKPGKYRCIAAFHHQWYYGELPLKGTNRFKHLARREANAVLIESEVQSFYSRFDPEERNGSCPCPYTAHLAQIAFDLSPSELDDPAHSSRVSNIFRGRAEPCYGDNNDGITVVDVSTPAKPRYCFASLDHGLEGEHAADCPPLTPLTAQQYLRFYYAEPEEHELAQDVELQAAEKLNVDSIHNLDDMPLLTRDAMCEAWPLTFAKASRHVDSSIGPVANLDKDQGPGSFNADTDAPKPEGSSLRILNLSRQNGSPGNPLSMLKDLGPGAISGLDASGNKEVDKHILRQILEQHPLKWVNIVGSSVTTDDIGDLLASHPRLFYHMEAIIHPQLFVGMERTSLGLPCPSAFFPAFRFVVEGPDTSFYSYADEGTIKRRSVSLPFFSTDQIIQNILDAVQRPELELDHMGVIFSCSYRGQGKEWIESDIQSLPDRSNDTFEASAEQAFPGYTFLFRFRQSGMDRYDGKCVIEDYGIRLPGELEYVDLDAFLAHMEGEGRPAPTTLDAVDALRKILGRSGTGNDS
ncbi:hypothetical protein DFP72DRAFT_307364 [Ephemerocybe angulata]|uniref:Uncharacterized protein n=1 Tax=Ephemerocybe angulata TaxID=980116 RepID=A0A8H6M5Z3_9AGAR|nr:hypothetical protein DFP72DRAFT_307364 [Tulosesus angulatus]